MKRFGYGLAIALVASSMAAAAGGERIIKNDHNNGYFAVMDRSVVAYQVGSDILFGRFLVVMPGISFVLDPNGQLVNDSSPYTGTLTYSADIIGPSIAARFGSLLHFATEHGPFTDHRVLGSGYARWDSDWTIVGGEPYDYEAGTGWADNGWMNPLYIREYPWVYILDFGWAYVIPGPEFVGRRTDLPEHVDATYPYQSWYLWSRSNGWQIISDEWHPYYYSFAESAWREAEF